MSFDDMPFFIAFFLLVPIFLLWSVVLWIAGKSFDPEEEHEEI